MSVSTVGTTTPVTTTNGLSTNATQVQTGLSSVASSITSAAQEDNSSSNSFFNTVFYPFIYIGGLITDAYKGMMGMFAVVFGFAGSKSDRMAIEFIETNLNALQGDVLQDALDKFSHLSSAKEKLHVFGRIQHSSDVSADNTRAFYDLLPIDMQNHLKRHIWIENGRSDNGLWLDYGNQVVATDIKAEIIHRAIEACLAE